MKLIDAEELDSVVLRLNTERDARITRLEYKLIDYVLFAFPTVDAVPVRHGTFIGTEYDGYADGNPVYYEWKCSECGCIFEDDEPTYNYCPNCGARMDAYEKQHSQENDF